ncbi:hypothetical protein K7432_004566 [Basidiobolus ranarum]|uniref:Helicase ATP-binding domain-containing protein n=1 Tax=Basidiobolus ranarum TaxID=34480 RepID=A0ABR2W4N6_9FUNG
MDIDELLSEIEAEEYDFYQNMTDFQPQATWNFSYQSPADSYSDKLQEPVDQRQVASILLFVTSYEFPNKCWNVLESERSDYIPTRSSQVHYDANRFLERSTSKTLERYVPRSANSQPSFGKISRELTNNATSIQDVALKSVSVLPDRFRSLFSFQTFNRMQSQCFDSALNSSVNMVISAPTGSGKTCVLELAMVKLLMSNKSSNAKIIYMAPIKALCSERSADWEQKFRPFGLTCRELTGDTNSTSIFDIKKCNIIVTTPEKWDSITRRWQDHQAFMKMIRLFMIDEVHMLNEKRGAALEAVVSRMKAISVQIRYIAISATVPNVNDIAEWLGEGICPTNERSGKNLACVKRFGEEYRPVKLNRFVYGYPVNNASPFLFDRNLNFR